MRYAREADRLVPNCVQHVRDLFLRLHGDERGQAMTEYTVLLCAVSALSAATVVSIGGTVLDKFTGVDKALDDFVCAVTEHL